MRRCSGVPRPVLPHEDGPALLRTEGLTKQYGRQTALDRVSFFAAPGEVLGLIGPNGSGKTTLLETVAGLLPADAGRIVWKGQILPAGCRRKVMFYLPDGIRPYQDQPVARVLSFFAAVYQRSSEQIANIISALSLIPTRADHHALDTLAQSRRPMDMMIQGWSMRRFQASQQ